jgi:hypothetical protein
MSMIETIHDLPKATWSQLQEIRPSFTKEEWERFQIIAAKRCFLTYCEVMSRSIGINFIIKPFHVLMAAAFEDIFFQRYNRLIISAPPRAGKSYLSSLFNSWLIGINDRNKHILTSYGAKLSETLYKQVHTFLLNPTFSKIFPNFSGFKRGKKYELEAGGEILVTSVGGALTGFTAGTLTADSEGIGILLVDDPLKSGYSMAALNELEDWWTTQARTRRTNKWGQILIATRFHTNDLHGMLMKTDGIWDKKKNPLGWRWLNIQALCENEDFDILGRKNGESFWEDNPIFSRAILEAERKSMGNKFSAMYQGQPISEGGSIVKPEYFCHEDLSKIYIPIKFLAADTALEENQEACQSVITVFGVSASNQELLVYEQISGRWDFVELLDNSVELAEQYQAKWYVIEDTVSGKSLRQVLEKRPDFTTEIVPIKPIRSKFLRLQKILPLLEQNKIKFPINYGPWFPPLKEALVNAPFITSGQYDFVDSFVNGSLYFQEFLDSEGISQQVQSVVKWGRNPKFRRKVERYGG